MPAAFVGGTLKLVFPTTVTIKYREGQRATHRLRGSAKLTTKVAVAWG
ncbi:hypothetical protein [Aestuariimicrobium ganziense]|nr:hypothetical protein [Aestuariimicrobium ganziense]